METVLLASENGNIYSGLMKKHPLIIKSEWLGNFT